jgi:hypothetical protein
MANFPVDYQINQVKTAYTGDTFAQSLDEGSIQARLNNLYQRLDAAHLIVDRIDTGAGVPPSTGGPPVQRGALDALAGCEGCLNGLFDRLQKIAGLVGRI